MQTLDTYNLTDWLLIFYIAFAAIQLIYYWLIFGRFVFSKPMKGSPKQVPVSVVISAKNEFPSLKKNLPMILSQDYPEFEVVVVNDASDDETIFLLEDLAREYDHLKIVTITQDLNFFKGKKFPLALGIKSATHEYLLLTDADCEPAGNNWISSMVSGFSDEKEVILGYGKYNEAAGFLNKVIRYETAFTALQYFSLALLGSPYMGVGRNLAYRKKLFIENKGFISHYNVSSGDDDLFINKVANRKNTFVQYSPESFTSSNPKLRFRTWWMQKRRHLSTGKHYKFKHKFILGAYSFTYLFFMVLFVVLLVIKISPFLLFIPLMARLISQLVIMHLTFNKLMEKKLLLISPVIELIIALIYPILFSINLVYKESKWK